MNDADRSRLSGPARLRWLNTGAVDVYAWALMPNHFHLLCKTAATTAIRQHAPAAHRLCRQFQQAPPPSRSSVPEPVQVHRLPGGSLPQGTGPLHPPQPLAVRRRSTAWRPSTDYPYCGHSAVQGRVSRPWQDIGHVLALFGKSRSTGAAGLPPVSWRAGTGGRTQTGAGRRRTGAQPWEDGRRFWRCGGAARRRYATRGFSATATSCAP
ncbi:MAG: hypothetical protein MZV70_73475 [Desulfobacterales bacterium]|nr:hypothetical protein [Desulfobacterales bacterium]